MNLRSAEPELAKVAVTRQEQAIVSKIGLVEKEFRVAVLNAVAAARRSPGTLAQIERLISSGQVEELINLAWRTGAISLADDYAALYTQAGHDTSKLLTNILDIQVGFDQVNERAVAHIRQERFRLITQFRDEQVRATRDALEDGVRRGLNPRDQARNFRRSIGLTQKQQQSVINYRNYLERAHTGDTTALHRALRDGRFDRSIERAVRTGEPLSKTQIDRMTTRYNERYIKYRSEVIARTEALRAVHTAQDEAFEQAIEEGHIERSELQREWITAIDGRERESHALLNGVVRGKDEPFEALGGNIMYPGDPSAPPEETIQCFPSGTLIHGAGLHGAIARRHEGALVEIVVGDGVNLAVTPNHPILARRGWVPAGFINEGDHLIHCDTPNFTQRPHPETAYGYTPAEKLYDFAEMVGFQYRPRRSVVNLHGDAIGEDVDVVTLPRRLRHHFDAAHTQIFGNLAFEPPNIPQGLLALDREALLSRVKMFGSVTNSVMRGSRELLALCLAQSPHPQLVGFAASALAEAEIAEAAFHPASRYPESFGHRENGLSSIVARLNRGKQGRALFSEVPVRRVRRIHYGGPVFNFETVSSGIMANGIVTHNCRCTLAITIKR